VVKELSQYVFVSENQNYKVNFTMFITTFFTIFANVQCHIIKNLLTSTVRAVREN
jgi:hypothetical protein